MWSWDENQFPTHYVYETFAKWKFLSTEIDRNLLKLYVLENVFKYQYT